MKINIVGNVVNFGYNLGKWLNDKGYKIDFFLFDAGFQRDLPEWEKDYGLTEIPITRFSARVVHRPLFPWMEVINKIGKCDVIISIGGYETILASRTGTPHIFWSMGNDLEKVPFSTQNIHARLCALVLRRALKRCKYIVYSMAFQKLTSIPRLRIKNTVFLPVPWDCQIYKKIELGQALRCIPFDFNSYELIVFAPARHEIDPRRYHYKGNEQIVLGFKEFFKKFSGKACLVFTRYGDYIATGKLVEYLNLREKVFFIDMLNKEDLRAMYSLPNIVVCDQFLPYPMTSPGFISIEALLCEVPLITTWDTEILDMVYDNQPPVFHARNAADICNRLLEVSKFSCEQRRENGLIGRNWVVVNHSKDSILPRFEALMKDAIGF